ncbi:hypothetical protein B0H16DRAFT_1561427 [Mycena metata]|uniref:Uncharacterized protein n=1 Tax=Mycena metata TaxID=1033252 RepID=A0AAD7N2Y8_9AGAR|nr:hypothetical protein B0H16DRAFT_1561427 [Mycena metata]
MPTQVQQPPPELPHDAHNKHANALHRDALLQALGSILAPVSPPLSRRDPSVEKEELACEGKPAHPGIHSGTASPRGGVTFVDLGEINSPGYGVEGRSALQFFPWTQRSTFERNRMTLDPETAPHEHALIVGVDRRLIALFLRHREPRPRRTPRALAHPHRTALARVAPTAAALDPCAPPASPRAPTLAARRVVLCPRGGRRRRHRLHSGQLPAHPHLHADLPPLRTVTPLRLRLIHPPCPPPPPAPSSSTRSRARTAPGMRLSTARSREPVSATITG